MSWTTPEDIQAQLERYWARGRILSEGPALFPLRIPLKGPKSEQLASEFGPVQDWITRLRAGAGLYRLEFRTVRHRVIGSNELPVRIWVESYDDALQMIGRTQDGLRFERICEMTRTRCPLLLDWLKRKPLRGLEFAGEWKSILDVVQWVQRHPRSGLYIREVDFPGVHTKFIEQHKKVLSELLELALPEEAKDASARGSSLFERRFGFREKSARVRFRFLDHSQQLPEGLSDLSLVQEEFARFVPGLRRVFITENEISYLAFPNVPDSLVIFGSGFSIESLKDAQWLQERPIHYWGDIDTHGFAILDQLRQHFPHVQSIMMDRQTFLAHRDYWVQEKKPTQRQLHHLGQEELELYQDLCHNRLGQQLRLEQELVRFPWVYQYLSPLAST